MLRKYVLARQQEDKGGGEASLPPPESLGYAMGVRLGSNVRQNLKNVDVGFFVTGLSDFLLSAEQDKEPELLMDTADIEQELVRYQEALQQMQQAQGEKNLAQGQEFLAENGARDGVKTLDSGLQYEVLRAGFGDRHPTVEDTVMVHYRGALIDGNEFDSSYARGKPAPLPLQGVIAGWQEAIPLMTKGAKWRLFIPSDLAYGDRGSPPAIGPHETLVFEVELLEIQ